MTAVSQRALTEARRVAGEAARAQRQVVADLGTWVEHDSPTGRRDLLDPLAERLAASCTGYGLTAELVDAPSGLHLHAWVEGHGEGRIALLCHHDTVYPAGTAAARPLRRSAGRLVGPGVADMKGGIAVAVHALRLLADGPRAFGRVELVSVPDEEMRTDMPATFPRLTGFDAALCLECGRPDGSLVSSRKGGHWMRLEAEGLAAHAGVDPEAGRNAVVAICEEALRLTSLHGARTGLSSVVTQIGGGEVINAVPERAWLSLDLRSADADDLAWARAEAERFLPHDGVAVRVGHELHVLPLERTDEVARLAAGAVAIAEAALEVRTRDVATGGVSDACHAADLGIPTLDGLGPVGGEDHSPGEYVEEGSFAPRIGLVAGLVTAVEDGLLEPN